MHRRDIIKTGLGALLAVAVDWAAPTAATDWSALPSLPDAKAAWMISAIRSANGPAGAEPVAMSFTSYGFAAKNDAARVIPDVLSFYQAQSAPGAMRDLTVGKLGDERAAIYDGHDTLRVLVVAVRTGANLLVVNAVGGEDGMAAFVTGFLHDFLHSKRRDARALIPATADLPAGWELASDAPMNILDETRH